MPAGEGPCSHLPFPAAFSELRRDQRGYPVPVVVPWKAGRPQFASTSAYRIFLVAQHRLCGICGLALDPTELYWRNGDADNADLYAAALTAGAEILGNRSLEPGGHRECVTFAAMACPYLSADAARRLDASVPGLERPRGEQRGEEGLIAAHRGWEYSVDRDGAVFTFGKLAEMRRYRDATDLADDLADAIATASPRLRREGGPELWSAALDEDTVETMAAEAIRAGAGGPARSTKIPRNAPCPCGSGKKAKHCHCH